MNAKNIWTIVKNRYRLPAKIQMNFELSFPEYLIGKCRITVNNAHEIKTKKVSLSMKGIVFSDTIPLSWFTSSVFIPWENVLEIDISNENCRLSLNDPREMTIDLPWSDAFTDYLKENKRLPI